METKVDGRIASKAGWWMPFAALWAVFGAFALIIRRAVGCPLAGCSNATIALLAGVALAFTLGALLTHSDRLAARERAKARR